MEILKRKPKKDAGKVSKCVDVEMPKVVMLDTDLLTVDKSYQRIIDSSMVNLINDEFDPDLFGILTVSMRDGKLYVVDGQHRLSAVKDFLKKVPCALWQGLTYEEECEKFIKLNSNRKSLNASIIFHGKVREGDKEANAVVRIMKRNGFNYNRHNQVTKNNVIGSPARMLQIYTDNGAEALNKLLNINRKAWHGDKAGITATMLVGLNTFLKENPQAKDEYIIRALESTDPTVIKGQALYYITADNISGVSGGSSRYIHIANAIKAAYNRVAPKSERVA